MLCGSANASPELFAHLRASSPSKIASRLPANATSIDADCPESGTEPARSLCNAQIIRVVRTFKHITPWVLMCATILSTASDLLMRFTGSGSGSGGGAAGVNGCAAAERFADVDASFSCAVVLAPFLAGFVLVTILMPPMKVTLLLAANEL